LSKPIPQSASYAITNAALYAVYLLPCLAALLAHVQHGVHQKSGSFAAKLLPVPNLSCCCLILPQVQDFSFPFPELYGVSFYPLLQSEEFPLNSFPLGY